MIRRIAAFALLALVLPVPVPAQVAQRGPAALDVLLTNFEQMVFDDGKESVAIAFARWREPVHALLAGDVAERYRDRIDGLFGELEALTGVPFALVDGDGMPGIQIFFPDRGWYRTATKTFPRPEIVECYTTPPQRDGALFEVEVVIPADLPEAEVERCLAHELLHAVGFRGHPDRTLDSALRNGRGPRTFTVNDAILVRTLYDARLRPDMNREELMTAARGLIVEFAGVAAKAADPVAGLRQYQPAPTPPAPMRTTVAARTALSAPG